MEENQPLLILNPGKTGGFYRHPLTTLLSVIDEDPHEDEYEDIDGCESRRQSINSEFRHHNWKFGLIRLPSINGHLPGFSSLSKRLECPLYQRMTMQLKETEVPTA